MPNHLSLIDDGPRLVEHLASAETMAREPAPVDVMAMAPPNPPKELQAQFVGASYDDAYREAVSFVRAIDDWSGRHGLGSIHDLGHVLDFGSGWGRISRVLATQIEPHRILATDVDPLMAALVGQSLPGVSVLTVDPLPPTVLGRNSVELVTAFSVFSHLSPGAHAAWAKEFGRIVKPGGLVVATFLDETFFAKVRAATAAKNRGEGGFADLLGNLFPDVDAAERAFKNGQVAYAGNGGGGVRTGDFYGWAAAPRAYVKRTWGEQGFDVVEWVRSEVLFPQACAVLRRRQLTDTGRLQLEGRRVAHSAGRGLPLAAKKAIRARLKRA